MTSSSVRMTRTLTRPASPELSGAFFALRRLFGSMPRKPKIHRLAVAGGGGASRGPRLSSRIVDDRTRATETDAIDLSIQTPPRCFACPYTANRMLEEPPLIVGTPGTGRR